MITSKMQVLQRHPYQILRSSYTNLRMHLTIVSDSLSNTTILTTQTRVFTTSQLSLRPDSILNTLKNDANLIKTVSKDFVQQKYTEAYIFYEQFSRRDEVREAREKVAAIQVNRHLL